MASAIFRMATGHMWIIEYDEDGEVKSSAANYLCEECRAKVGKRVRKAPKRYANFEIDWLPLSSERHRECEVCNIHARHLNPIWSRRQRESRAKVHCPICKCTDGQHEPRAGEVDRARKYLLAGSA